MEEGLVIVAGTGHEQSAAFLTLPLSHKLWMHPTGAGIIVTFIVVLFIGAGMTITLVFVFLTGAVMTVTFFVVFFGEVELLVFTGLIEFVEVSSVDTVFVYTGETELVGFIGYKVLIETVLFYLIGFVWFAG